MSSAQKLKQKLFSASNVDPSLSQLDLTANLTIEIPHLGVPPVPSLAKPHSGGSEQSNPSNDPSPGVHIPLKSAESESPKIPYRKILQDKLGSKYVTTEEYRLDQDRARKKHWKRWGPYLSERQWATVREDYSANGDAWTHFPHEHARSRAYRWGEDGIGGISDNHGRLCWSLALWNEEDDILKERLFGVTGHQGNHGEDVKELYYYLDSTVRSSLRVCLWEIDLVFIVAHPFFYEIFI